MVNYIPKAQRRCYAQFRCGVAPIRCETDRYTQGTYIPYDERLCKLCTLNETENELHVFCTCPVYDEIRSELYQNVFVFNPGFINLSNEDKFIYLFKEDTICKATARAAEAILRRRRDLVEILKIT